MKKLTFTIGAQDAGTKEFYSLNSIRNYLTHALDYATFTECQGSYKYDDGAICSEPSLKVEVILFEDDYFVAFQVA